MARYAGKSGGITNAGSNVEFSNWEIDAKGDALDVTGFDSAGKKEFIAGLTEWSGSATGFATGDDTSYSPGTSLAAVVFSSGSAGAPKLTGTIITTGLKVSAAVDGAVTVDLTFQGTGTLTYGTV